MQFFVKSEFIGRVNNIFPPTYLFSNFDIDLKFWKLRPCVPHGSLDLISSYIFRNNSQPGEEKYRFESFGEINKRH